MSRTDALTQTPSTRTPATHAHHTTAPQEPTMSRAATRLSTLVALVTIVLTITLPLVEGPGPHRPHLTPTHHTTSTTPAPAPSTPSDSRPSKADKAAAHHDGCRQTPANSDLISRPSCRSGMPATHDRGASQTPPTLRDDRGPAAMNEVPPAWSGHWRQAAHSPYHRSQA